MQEERIMYLKDVYLEKNDKHQHIIKNTQWIFTVMLFFSVLSCIGIWLMYKGVLISDGHRSWVEGLIFFFGVSFVISSILMINIHKEPRVSLPISSYDLDIHKNYEDTVQKLQKQIDKIHRFFIGLQITSIISIFCLILIMLLIL
jgi:branched-subunit amino acid ABC-type transport system permease component